MFSAVRRAIFLFFIARIGFQIIASEVFEAIEK